MAKKRSQRVHWRILGWVSMILLILIALTTFQVALLSFVNPPLGITAIWNRMIHAHALKQADWVPLEELSPHIRRAVLASEDQRFLSHKGFDFVEMANALEGLLKRKRLRGASTITMQVARTVYLWHERTVWRKMLEAYYTILIEAFCSKERILEVYLNTVDWGNGFHGVQMAAKGYFGVRASDLTPHQAAILAAILPSPHRWSPTKPGPYVLARQKRILKDMEMMPLLP